MKITVYSTPSCPWCHKTKEFFKYHKIPFHDIDVSQNPSAAKEMISITGQTSVPVITSNKEIIIGFDESKLKRLIRSF